MVEPRWAPFLVWKDRKNYAEGFRDDSLQHDDYKKGIHISIPDRLSITQDSEFEYGTAKMKAIHVQRCPHFQDHLYVFAKEL
jgi:hypothetical protein